MPLSRTSPPYLVAILIASLFFWGCDDSPQQRLREAQTALASQQSDLAEERLQQVLAADPNHFEARRLLAQVDVHRGDYAAAEEKLFALWEEYNLGDETALDAAGRRSRGLTRDQFNNLYVQWLESINPLEEPELFEEIARKGLDREPRNPTLNPALAAFYRERAERFIERGDKLRAAEELDKVNDLRLFADDRRQTQERAHALRREVFLDEARLRFEENLLPELLAADRFDPDQELLLFHVDQPVDRRLDPADEEALRQTRALAMQSLVPMIAQLAVAISGSELDDLDLASLELPSPVVQEENLSRGRYRMTASLPLAEILTTAFALAEHARTSPEAPPEEEPSSDTDAPHHDPEQDSP